MTQPQLLRLLFLWQQRLGLERWQIDLDFKESADEEDYATVNWPWSYDQATVRLSPEWRKWSEDFASKTLCHELMHLHLRGFDHFWKRVVRPRLAPDVQRVLDAQFLHEIEGAVDRLALRFSEVV